MALVNANDLIKSMLDRKDPKHTSSVVDCLRSHGMQYPEIFRRAQKVDPGLTETQFEDLMYAADEAGGED